MPTATVTVEFDRFNRLAEEFPALVGQVVRQAAFNIELRAKLAAPVKFGALKNSIFTIAGTGESTLPQAQAAALARRPDGTFLDEADKPRTPSEAVVAVGMSYGLYVEMGTRHTAARPYLVPALEAERPAFEAKMRQLETLMREVR